MCDCEFRVWPPGSPVWVTVTNEELELQPPGQLEGSGGGEWAATAPPLPRIGVLACGSFGTHPRVAGKLRRGVAL